MQKPLGAGSRRGTAMTEYALIVSIVAIALMLVTTMFGRQIAALFQRSSSALGTGEVAPAPAAMPGQYTSISDYSFDGRGGPGSTPGIEPPTTAAERLAAARALLNSFPDGRTILAYLDAHGVSVVSASGDGSYYSSGSSSVTLNTDGSAEDIALTLIHEANHARYDKEGVGANIATDTRADYVNKMIEEETVGTVASIELKNALLARGRPVTATFPGEGDYNAAYARAVADLRAANPGATPAQLETAGRAAGRAAVRRDFDDGTFTTSNTGATYPTYYGSAWDGAHP
ncbi:MAG: hypothetical protein HZA54_01405 [Planctomycetes bacterium]|nr:hypothetical protein [Planctomycetota bacterium]